MASNVQFLNNFQQLISPIPSGTPLLVVLLEKLKNAFMFTFLFLDQFVWLGKSGIIKNKGVIDLILRIALYCLLGSSISTTALKIAKLGKLSSSKKKIKMELKDDENHQDKMCQAKLKISFKKILSLIKSIMDIVVAIGLLKLVPWIITTRVTGAFGFITSLISCYELFPPRLKCKTS